MAGTVLPADAMQKVLPDFTNQGLKRMRASDPKKDWQSVKTGAGHGLEHILAEGLSFPQVVKYGLNAHDAECYDTFRSLFRDVIQEHHGEVGISENQIAVHEHPLLLQKCSVRIRIARNVCFRETGEKSATRFPPGMSAQDRTDVEECLLSALRETSSDKLGGEGSYFAATDRQEGCTGKLGFGTPNETMAAAGLSQDWPHSRGVWASPDEKIFAWINEEDHLRLGSLEENCDSFQAVWERLHQMEHSLQEKGGLEFCFSQEFGALTTCPTNAGTGMRASVLLPLPALQARLGTSGLKAAARRLGLDLRGTHGEHSEVTDAVFDVSNRSRAGGYARLLRLVTMGVNELIKEEKAAREKMEEEDEEVIVAVRFGIQEDSAGDGGGATSEEGGWGTMRGRAWYAHSGAGLALMFQRNMSYYFTPLFLALILDARTVGEVLLWKKVLEAMADVGAPLVVMWVGQALGVSHQSQARSRTLDLLTLPMAVSFMLFHLPVTSLGAPYFVVTAGVYGCCYSVYSINFRALVAELQLPQSEVRELISLSSVAENLGTVLMFAIFILVLASNQPVFQGESDRASTWAFTLVAAAASVLFLVLSALRGVFSIVHVRDTSSNAAPAQPAALSSLSQIGQAAAVVLEDARAAGVLLGAGLAFTSNANLMAVFMLLSLVSAFGVPEWQAVLSLLVQALVATVLVAPFSALVGRAGTRWLAVVTLSIALVMSEAPLVLWRAPRAEWLLLWVASYGLVHNSACSFLADYCILWVYQHLKAKDTAPPDTGVLHAFFRTATKVLTGLGLWLFFFLLDGAGFDGRLARQEPPALSMLQVLFCVGAGGLSLIALVLLVVLLPAEHQDSEEASGRRNLKDARSE